MERLSTPLVCLTVQHVLDDADAVEGLLAEDATVEKCLPLALRDVLAMPSIPNAATTLKYLIALWYRLPRMLYEDAKYYRAAEDGLTYLLAYINRDPDALTIRDAMSFAAANDHIDTLQYLLQLPFARTATNIFYALFAAAKRGNVNILSYLIPLMREIFGGKETNNMIRSVIPEINTSKQGYQSGFLVGNAADIENIEKSERFLNGILLGIEA